MGFLERAIRRGVSQGVGSAIGKVVEQAVAPKAEELANKAAVQLDRATSSAAQATQQTAQTQTAAFGGAFSSLQRAAQGFANSAAANMKVCPACNQPTDAEKTFCPSCGAKLPEQTLAQGSVCSSCGKQNDIGIKFCSGCGAKLPFALAEEQAASARDEQVMAQWGEKLPAFPKWTLGGSEPVIEDYGGSIMFAVRLQSSFAAENAVRQYREILTQNGFRPAGEYPDPCHLYKMVGSTCYHCDTEHCFDGDSDAPSLYFNIEEPRGGFDYVKPEPKKQLGLRDLFGR